MPEFNIIAILPQKNRTSSIWQLGAKKPIINKYKKVIGLMGAALYIDEFIDTKKNTA